MTAKAFVALVTCFNDDETINFDATRAQVRRQVQAGNNIMCAGTNGDFTALTYDEKVALTEAVVDEVAGKARVIVNAGLGKGAPYGKGSHYANRQTIETNVLGAAIQTEAAMAIFREQKAGHLVLIASVTALRGMPKSMTTYGASKAFLASLGEGIRSELMGKPELDIDVTVLYPGYIRSEMNEKVEQKTKFMVDTETGVRAMVVAIEGRKAKALVPAKPWVAVGSAMKVLPLSVVRKML